MRLKTPCVLLAVLSAGFPAIAGQPYFNPAALGLSGEDPVIDIRQFQQMRDRQFQEEGRYFVVPVINQQPQPGQWMQFHYHEKQQQLQPVVSRSQWLRWGLRPDVSPAFAALADTDDIPDITVPAPDVRLMFHAAQQRLEIVIPQQDYVSERDREADPSLWDDGISALLLGYDYRVSQRRGTGGQETRHALSLESGINSGPWRLRSLTGLDSGNDGPRWQSDRLWLFRAVAPLRSELQLGQVYSSDPLFDSRAYTGIRLASDEQMLPRYLQGYAPVIRGTTAQPAEMTIRQQGIVVRRESLPGGPYVIRDLNSGLSGDSLDITVEEADGTVRQWRAPAAAMPVMQREGQLKYSLDAGKNRYRHTDTPDDFLQAAAAYGVNSLLTVYGGAAATRQRLSGGAGAGLNLGIAGGVSLDFLTTEAARQRWRVQYHNSIPYSGTSLSLHLIQAAGIAAHTVHAARRLQDRTGTQQWSGTVSQSLGGSGSVALHSHYHRAGHHTDTGHDISYYHAFRRVSYSVSFQHQRYSGRDRPDNRLALSLHIPWDIGGRRLQSQFYATHQPSGQGTQASVSGTAGAENQLDWVVNHGCLHHEQNGGAALRWRHELADTRLQFHTNGQYRTWDAGVRSGLVLHGQGITASRHPGESNALADTDGIGRIRVTRPSGGETDRSGFRLITQMQAYEKNTLYIDPETLPENADIDDPVRVVIPTKGALVPVRFTVQKGSRVIYALQTATGVVPFGARVQVQKPDGSRITGLIGDDGEVYLNGLPASGRVQAVWDETENGRCSAELVIPPPDAGLVTIPLTCR